ncbi:MAG TPA: glycine--tRNA ligase subunit beta [Kofleriaceae bacterium]|nr:glycine--tRNA ligase subunit beta [Kofleriaceae bacterium]
MAADLLFEIGLEEVPAGFLAQGMIDLERLATTALTEARLGFDRVRVVGTPRRLVLHVSQIADRQLDLSERLVGPPAKVAWDEAGTLTRAGQGFARKNGVSESALERAEVEGRKGEYLVCTREVEGQAATAVLVPLLENLCRAIPWPKSMRWAHREESFVRPVHWLVALLGEEVLPVSFVGVKAGRTSRGHRFLAPAPLEVTARLDAYVSALRQAFVVVEPETRRETIRAELGRIERETGATVRPDDALVAEVANLVEYPVAVCGSFDAAYLEVPAEVIVSAMRAHQRYFAMNAPGGELVNRFITIAGTVTRDVEVVRAGNQRVLAARLADAQFFFREDGKASLEAWAARLGDVVFQAKLGSIAAKAQRIGEVAGHLAAATDADAAHTARAAALCKADLVSHMVGEFPELQGIMGMHYARGAGEPEQVAIAIAEHYLPRGAGDALPASAVGAVVGLADRIDTIVGCFAVGLIPSGSADPYGLRRAALAIIAILRDRGWPVRLDGLVDWAAAALAERGQVILGERRAEVLDFFRTRLRGVLVDTGLPADCVDAALTAGFEDVPDVIARAGAVAALRKRPDFEPLATAFKRVANILKGEGAGADPDPGRFNEDAERALWTTFTDVRARVDARLAEADYGQSLQILAELKEPVDRFFDAVLVMDENAEVRANRLALLGSINDTFTRIADFRQLTV